MTYCCEEFAKQASEPQTPVGGFGGLYPRALMPLAQFELNEDGKTWNIFGCCGGGCYIVEHMRFCPYCGTAL